MNRGNVEPCIHDTCIHNYAINISIYINMYINLCICICIMNTNPYTNMVPTLLSSFFTCGLLKTMHPEFYIYLILYIPQVSAELNLNTPSRVRVLHSPYSQTHYFCLVTIFVILPMTMVGKQTILIFKKGLLCTHLDLFPVCSQLPLYWQKPMLPAPWLQFSCSLLPWLFWPMLPCV